MGRQWFEKWTSSAQLSQISEKLSLGILRSKVNPAGIGSEELSCQIWVWLRFDFLRKV